MCGLSPDIGTRIIGCLGFVSSLVVMIETGSQLSVKSGNVHVSSLLGVTLDDLQPQDAEQISRVLKTFLAFSALYCCSSCLLIYASIVHTQLFAVPWMCCEALSLGFHVISIMEAVQNGRKTDTWIFVGLFSYFVFTAYMWSMVCYAMLTWSQKNVDTVSVATSTHPCDDLHKGFTSSCDIRSPV